MWTTLEEAITAARVQSTLDSAPTLIELIQSWRTEQLDGVWGKQSETIGTIYLTSALLIYLWQLQLSQRILVGDCRELWRQSPLHLEHPLLCCQSLPSGWMGWTENRSGSSKLGIHRALWLISSSNSHNLLLHVLLQSARHSDLAIDLHSANIVQSKQWKPLPGGIEGTPPPVQGVTHRHFLGQYMLALPDLEKQINT